MPNIENFPDDWELLPLSSTAKAYNNGFVDGDWIESPYIQNSGIRLVQTGNIGIGRFIDNSETRKFISFHSFKDLNCKWVYPDDILICRLADPIGRACIVPNEIGHCVTSVDCTIYRPDENKVNKSYILHFLNSERFLKRASTIAGGSTRQRISRSNLGKMTILVPPRPEQRRIAEILDTIDEAIQKTEALISKLKAMKQGLLHDLLTRGLDKTGKLRDPKAHPEQFKDSPLGRIPMEWVILSIKDFASVKGGKRLPKRHLYSESPTKYRYLRVLDFFEREIDYNSLQYLKEETFEALERYEIQERYVFISIAGSIGYAGVFNSQIKDRVILTENAARLVIDDKFQPEYLAFQLNSGIVQDQIQKEIGTGGGVPKLALHRIENLKVICPFLNEQMRIVDNLDSHDVRIRTEEQYRDKLKLQKKGLMHDLLTGKVRVKV